MENYFIHMVKQKCSDISPYYYIRMASPGTCPPPLFHRTNFEVKAMPVISSGTLAEWKNLCLLREAVSSGHEPSWCFLGNASECGK